MKNITLCLFCFGSLSASQENLEMFLHEKIDRISNEIIRKEIYPCFEYDETYWYLTGQLDAYYDVLNITAK